MHTYIHTFGGLHTPTNCKQGKSKTWCRPIHNWRVWLQPHLRVPKNHKHPRTDIFFIGYKHLFPYYTISRSFRQLRRPAQMLHCSHLIIQITSTWLPILVANSTQWLTDQPGGEWNKICLDTVLDWPFLRWSFVSEIQAHCPEPPPVPHATWTGAVCPYYLDDSVQYSCHLCYTGGGNTTCLDTGHWSHDISCQGQLSVFFNLFVNRRKCQLYTKSPAIKNNAPGSHIDSCRFNHTIENLKHLIEHRGIG